MCVCARARTHGGGSDVHMPMYMQTMQRCRREQAGGTVCATMRVTVRVTPPARLPARLQQAEETLLLETPERC
jgi:hypothetical protein